YAHSRFRTPRNRRQDLRTARALRSQRFDPAWLGGNGRSLGERKLAASGGFGGALVAAEPDTESHGSRRYGHGARPVRRRDRDGGALRLRHAGAAFRARLPLVLLHLAADQQAHRRIWRLARKPHALSARG